MTLKEDLNFIKVSKYSYSQLEIIFRIKTYSISHWSDYYSYKIALY